MPRLEYRGILARPGPYKYKWGTEVKTWEELKKAFQRTQELKLTLGHPLTPDGRPRLATVEDYLGRVIPVINEEKQVIEGLFRFHDEEWDKIPEHLREKIVNDLPIEISAGFNPGKVINGSMTGMLYDHVALLADGENPICPLGECGINVRLESDSGDSIMTYEQATSTRDEPEEPAQEEKKEEESVVREGTGLITFTQEQFDKLISTLKPPEQPEEEAGAESLEEEKSEPEIEEPVTAKAPEPSLEPERAFPAGKPGKAKSPYLKEDGSVEVPSDIYLGATKRKKT